MVTNLKAVHSGSVYKYIRSMQYKNSKEQRLKLQQAVNRLILHQKKKKKKEKEKRK